MLTIDELRQLLTKPKRYCLVGDNFSIECEIPHFRGIQHGVWSGSPKTIDPFSSPEGAKMIREWFAWRQFLIRKRTKAVQYQALAKLQNEMQLNVATQCVDGLIALNGVQDAVELYGNVFAARCSQCDEYWPADQNGCHPTICPACGGAVWPDVCLFNWNRRESIQRDWFRQLDQESLLLSIGENEALTVADLPCSKVEVTPHVFRLISANQTRVLPAVTLDKAIEKGHWPDSLGKPPAYPCLHRNVVYLLWLMTA